MLLQVLGHFAALKLGLIKMRLNEGFTNAHA